MKRPRVSNSDQPTMTIAIATLNCAEHLKRLFAAFSLQSLPRKEYEVIMVDGGSTDGTREVGEEFGARVLNRPGQDPVQAKHTAFLEARGQYLTYLDHDEVPEHSDCFERRVRFMQRHPEVHALQGSGFHCPPDYPFVNQYVNDFGDPFSYFIYGISKDEEEFVPFMKRNYRIVSENREGVIFDFTGEEVLPLIELTGMGSTLDLEFFRGRLGERFREAWSIPHLFYYLMEVSPRMALLYNDPLMHYSAERMDKYKRKLEWRVKNNVHHQNSLGASGFLGRAEKKSSRLRFKKYLFIPYVLTVLPVALDTLGLMIRRRRWGYAMHFPLCFYVLYLIFWHYALKLSGHTPKVLGYGG